MKTDTANPKDEQLQEMKVEDLKKLIDTVNFEQFERTEALPDEELEETHIFNNELPASGEN